MTDVTEAEPAANAVVTADATDRRRPGRLEKVSPTLLPMLRSAEPEIVFDPEDADQTAAIRGLAFGLLLSAPIWVAIAYFGTWLLS